MTSLDYYEILGISRDSDDRTIKKAYKRLAMKFHPDRNQGNKNAEDKFKEIKIAYETLINKEKRSIYDQYGHEAFQQNNINNNTDFNQNSDFGDIFGEVFGDIFGKNSQRKKQKSNINYNIELTLEEAVKGTSRKIKIPILIKCSICKGTGARYATSIIKCITCNGYGQIHIRQGFFSVQQTCVKCNGNGKIIKDICLKCNGNGKYEKYTNLFIKIPSGVSTGDRIKLSKDYNSYNNIYFNIKIIKHAIFTRENNNLYCKIPINFAVATLGGNIEVPTIDGKVKLKIPAETQTGRLFRIKGKGIKLINSFVKGDLLCKVIVETPVKLNEKQKQLFKELAESFNISNCKNTPQSKRFIDGVKEFFENLTG